jgi:ABC-type polar amino acid transport system ATPase subunit
MRIISGILAENYRMKNVCLGGLQDLNILIGPNNCGKSSILELIGLLETLQVHEHEFECQRCKEKRMTTPRDPSLTSGVSLQIQPRMKYLGKRKISVTFELVMDQIERLMSKESKQRASSFFEKHEELILPLGRCPFFLDFSERDNQMLSHHMFPYSQTDLNLLKEKLLSILKIPEERLGQYKQKDLTDYIRNQQIRANVMSAWLGVEREIGDPKIDTYNTTSLDFVRKIEDEDFVTPIREQGSGVRSICCLAADILSKNQAKIVLIDEPELGLNPSGKHALLRFLTGEAAEKQIFITTHDPTFANPILWDRDRVALFMFSPVSNTFRKIDLDQSKDDPSTFGGFLPHTTSLKRIHLYVEGKLDVYTFQIFLRSFLKNEYPDDWFARANQIGVFHLAGDYWNHLVYTIPQTPYHSIVVLDGDKRDAALDAVQKANEALRSPRQTERFKFCKSISQLKYPGRPKTGAETRPVLVYCLQKKELEDYLDPKPADKRLGPNIAESMMERRVPVPIEIENIFRSLRLSAPTRKPRVV